MRFLFCIDLKNFIFIHAITRLAIYLEKEVRISGQVVIRLKKIQSELLKYGLMNLKRTIMNEFIIIWENTVTFQNVKN